MTKYKHIIWDWNGTIINDANLVHMTICQMLIARNLPEISFQYLRDNFCWPLTEFYHLIGLYNEGDDFEELIDIPYHKIYDDIIKQVGKLHQDIPEILNFLYGTTTQSILSARHHNELLEDVKHLQINSYFQNVLGIEKNKSNYGKLEQGKKLLGQVNIPHTTTLMIGDSLHDFDVASKLGIDCILIAKGINSFGVLQQSGTTVLREHKELYNVL